MSNDTYANQSQDIEQLWYTWSNYGLGSMAVGNRIRAASPGLSDTRSVLVQNLDRYLRYELPEGMNPHTVVPQQAPISLSLSKLSSNEYILVNKIYTGRDVSNRPGVFFAHLLCSSKMHPSFHAKYAILLWQSSFWRFSDANHDTSARLPPLSPGTKEFIEFIEGSRSGRFEGQYEKEYIQERSAFNFKATFKREANPTLPKPDFISVRDCLLFVFQAYFTMQGYQRIYIAAPADAIANIIFGLTRCLPHKLLERLTFSTYEHNLEGIGSIGGKDFLLVGTCWDQYTQSNLDLPATCYTDHLAYNVFSGTHSPLKGDPLVQHFANYAVNCLISDNFGELDRLIDKMESMPVLDIRTFLQYYRQIIIEAQAPTREGVGVCFDTPDTATDFLSRLVVQEFIITEALKDAEWRVNTLKPGLQLLFNGREKYQGLAEALAAFAMALSQKTPDCVNTWHTNGTNNAGYANTFIILIEMMSCIADKTSKAWHQQPELLLPPQQPQTLQQQEEQIFSKFVRIYQDVYFTLLGYWTQLDPPVAVQRITPLLDLNLVQDRLTRFYATPLPAQWKYYVTEQVVRSSNLAQPIGAPETDIAEMIATYAEIDWSKATDLFLILVHLRYLQTFDLLKTLLDSRAIPPGGYTRLISRISLNVIDQVYILKRYGPKFLPMPQDEEAMLNQLSLFSGSNQAEFAQKQDILKSWLKSPYPQLTYWFTQPGNLDKVLKQINLAIPSESNWFLEEFGSTPPTSQIPSSTVENYARYFLESLEPGKLGKSNYLEYLEQNPGILQKLPLVIQQGVENQIKLSRLLKNPSFRAQDLKALSDEVYSRGIGGREKLAAQLVDPLANVLALYVETDTHLSALAQPLDTAFTPFTFQIFYRMAEIVRDSIAQQDTKMLYKVLLKSYIRFALSSDSVFFLSERDYKHFYYTFLDLLLQSTSESEIQQLDIETGGKTLRKWHDYKASRSNVAPVNTARSGNAQLSPANQSQGGSMNQIVASGGNNASNAIAPPSKQDRRPCQNPPTQPTQTQQTQKSNMFRRFFNRFGLFRPAGSPPPLKQKNAEKKTNTRSSSDW